jgi:hypothetical protein
LPNIDSIVLFGSSLVSSSGPGLSVFGLGLSVFGLDLRFFGFSGLGITVCSG